jgi:hypothetical protein
VRVDAAHITANDSVPSYMLRRALTHKSWHSPILYREDGESHFFTYTLEEADQRRYCVLLLIFYYHTQMLSGGNKVYSEVEGMQLLLQYQVRDAQTWGGGNPQHARSEERDATTVAPS